MRKVINVSFLTALNLLVQGIIFFLAAKITADVTLWYVLFLNIFIALALFGIALVLSIFLEAKGDYCNKKPKSPISGKPFCKLTEKDHKKLLKLAQQPYKGKHDD